MNQSTLAIHCHGDVARPDEITVRLRSLADVWRDITGYSNEQVARLARRDWVGSDEFEMAKST
jgi:hypothetical protein